MGFPRFVALLFLMTAWQGAPAFALVRFECGTHRALARLEQRDLVLFPGSLSEKRLLGIIPAELLSTLGKKGLPDRTYVRARIRVSDLPQSPENPSAPGTFKLISIEEPTASELEARDSTSVLVRESSEGCRKP